jgi:transposase
MVAERSVVAQTAAGTEGGRRPTGVPAAASAVSDPEVVAHSTRRRLTVAYKLKVLDTVTSLRERGNGAVGAYLRTEGLYYSSVKKWERQRSAGQLTSQNRGRHEKSREALLAENKQLRRKIDSLENRLAKTELVVDLQKKLSTLVETHSCDEMSAAG